MGVMHRSFWRSKLLTMWLRQKCPDAYFVLLWISRFDFVCEAEQLEGKADKSFLFRHILFNLFGGRVYLYDHPTFEFGKFDNLTDSSFNLNFMRTRLPEHLLHTVYQRTMYNRFYGVYANCEQDDTPYTDVMGIIDPARMGQFMTENSSTTWMVDFNEIWRVRKTYDDPSLNRLKEQQSRVLILVLLLFEYSLQQILSCYFFACRVVASRLLGNRHQAELWLVRYRLSFSFKLAYWFDQHCSMLCDTVMKATRVLTAAQPKYQKEHSFLPGSGWYQVSSTNSQQRPLVVSFMFGGLQSKTAGGLTISEFNRLLKDNEYDCNMFAARDLSQTYYLGGIAPISSTLNATAEYLVGLMEKFKSTKLILIGHCRGGYAALLLSTMFSNTKVVLFNPTTFIAPTHYAHGDMEKYLKANPSYYSISKCPVDKTNCIKIYYSTTQNQEEAHGATVQQFVDEACGWNEEIKTTKLEGPHLEFGVQVFPQCLHELFVDD